MSQLTHSLRPRLGAHRARPAQGTDWRGVARPAVLALCAIGVATRVAVMLLGQVSVGAGLLEIAGIVVVGAAVERLVERSVRARAAEVRAEGVRELSYLLDTVRRLSLAHEPDAVVREVIVAAGRAMARDGMPRPRAALIRVDEGRIREGYEHDDIGDMGGYDLPLAAAPAVAAAVESGRAVACATAALQSPLREMTERLGVVLTVYAPIRVGGDTYGVLATGLRHAATPDASDLRLLEGMADLLGLAIANADRLKLERTHLHRVEALERAKGAFLNRASHELRTPLTVLRGYLHLMEDGAFGPLPEELIAADVVPSLVTSVEDIHALVDGMLVAARLEYGVELMLEPLDLREVVRETVRGVEETFADQPSPTLITEMPAGPVTVLADREQLSTVVANLVRNAMRFSPEHSEVRCIVAARGGVVGAVTVTDHGPGIPAEQVGRLFTRFGRIDVPGAAGARGAGLGLYVARELARMHGGDVTVRTQVGVGSSFEVTLPLDTGGAAAARPVVGDVSGREVQSAPAVAAPVAAQPVETRGGARVG
ncbi:MAG TPA: HAMP domain-containing sensor histidine kinase [Candidatus Dormibacteraeota bacterium]|nr:HAMP domain-containing sensor histidine kinase [Candidatus Dormibacteraeota bacterium]